MQPAQTRPGGHQPSQHQKSSESSTGGSYHTALESRLESRLSPVLPPTESGNSAPRNLLTTPLEEVVPAPGANDAAPASLVTTSLPEVVSTPGANDAAPADIVKPPLPEAIPFTQAATAVCNPSTVLLPAAVLPSTPLSQRASIPPGAGTLCLPLLAPGPIVLNQPSLTESVSASRHGKPSLVTSSGVFSSAPTRWTASTGSTASTDKRSSSPTSRAHCEAVTHLELCVACAVIVFAGVLVLFIAFSTGLWPFKTKTTITPRLQTMLEERSFSQPFFGLDASTDAGPTGDASADGVENDLRSRVPFASDSLKL